MTFLTSANYFDSNSKKWCKNGNILVFSRDWNPFNVRGPKYPDKNKPEGQRYLPQGWKFRHTDLEYNKKWNNRYKQRWELPDEMAAQKGVIAGLQIATNFIKKQAGIYEKGIDRIIQDCENLKKEIEELAAHEYRGYVQRMNKYCDKTEIECQKLEKENKERDIYTHKNIQTA